MFRQARMVGLGEPEPGAAQIPQQHQAAAYGDGDGGGNGGTADTPAGAGYSDAPDLAGGIDQEEIQHHIQEVHQQINVHGGGHV